VRSRQTAYWTASARIGTAVSSQLRGKPPREQDRALYRVAARAFVCRETGGSVVTVLRSVIGDALAGFGTFSTRDRAAPRSRNPHAGETA